MTPDARDALLNAIAKARRWIDGITTGNVNSFDDIASEKETPNVTFVYLHRSPLLPHRSCNPSSKEPRPLISRSPSSRNRPRTPGTDNNNRPSLPAHLPREDIRLDLEHQACPCCGGAMQVIGEDRSQRLDMIPAQYQVVVTRRPKYACRQCQEGVVQAPAPARLIEGGLPTERLVAHVLVAKYADHSPLYRQCQIMARQGIAIDRSVLAFWVGYAAAEVKPLWRLMREELLRSTKLFADETPVPVLDPGRGRTKTGLWALPR